jgi:photosystem II stability/assembly factor-like uncharacterized protein
MTISFRKRICAGWPALFLTFAGAIRADVNRWTSLGPNAGGVVSALASDPQRPRVVYAAMVQGGLYRSADAGATWESLETGVPRSPGSGPRLLTSIAVDPANSYRLYAGAFGGGDVFFKSEDGGLTWRSSTAGLGGQQVVSSVAVDPADPRILYMSTRKGTSQPFDLRTGLFQSRDAGATWTFLDTPVSSGAIAIDPLSNVYASGGAGVVKSSDRGATWTSLAGSPATPVLAIAIDPASPVTVYAGTSNAGVFRSRDAGATWVPVNAGLGNLPVRSIAVSPLSSSVFAATDGGLFVSADGGDWWSVSGNSLRVPMSAVAAAPGGLVYSGAGGALAAGVTPAPVAVYRSLDDGRTWEAARAGLAAVSVFALALDPSSPDGLAIGTDLGVFRTADGGTSWAPANQGLPDDAVTALAFDPASPSTLYSGTSLTGFIGTRSAGIFKTVDGAQSWFPIQNGIRSIAITSLVVDPTRDSVVYAGTINPASSDSGLFRSTDAGGSWVKLLSGYVYGIAIDPTNASTIYAAKGTGGGGVSKSTDGGETWLDRNTGLFNLDVRTIAVDPANSSRVYAGGSGGVYRSNDAGASWLPAIGLNGITVNAVAIDPRDPAVLFAGTSSGAFRSSDFGAHFLPIQNGLNAPINAIAADPRTRGRILAGTAWRGVYAMTAVGPEICSPDATTLCVNAGRFRVRAAWKVPPSSGEGEGQVIPLTGDAGAFWFFTPNNVELLVKVVDGRAVNGEFWFFSAALSNVEYTITVTDLQTGETRTYFNSFGELSSRSDTAAF